MKGWEAAAWLCAAVVVGQSALELNELRKHPLIPDQKPVKAVQYDTGMWQEHNTAAVALCKAAVEAAALKAGLTVQDMGEAPIKRLVDHHVRSCVIKNGLSV